MYVYRAFDTSDITNKSRKCNLKYWFELFLISFETFDMVLYYIRTTLQDTMQHAAWPFDPSDIPWILQNSLFSQTSFNWPTFLWSLPTAVLDDLFSSLGGYFEITSHSWLLNLIETRCASFDTSDITFKLQYLISHAKTSLFVNCAGGTQGVQLLDWSNKGQVRAIRLRRVWVTWHPIIWCWSLWIG